MAAINILHLEDDPVDAELLKSILAEEGLDCDICWVRTPAEFLSAIQQGGRDVIVADYSLPGFDGLSALAIAKEKSPDVPFIFLSGKMGEELAIDTLKCGATDYVLKSRMSRLVPSLHRALSEAKERYERRQAALELRESHERLRSLAGHLQSIREEERLNIAREIHDELGQILTALKIDLDFIKKKMPKNERLLHEKVEADLGLVDETIRSVKRICNELRPGILDHLGIEAALEWQSEEFQKRTGVSCMFVSEDEEIEVDINRATTIFRIVQEALTNVTRHADAAEVKISLGRAGNDIVLEITDNGRGITSEQRGKMNSFGLLGMRERVYQWGGDIEITGRKNKGTSVRARIPLA
jgi:signal transduction histidine kinase